MVKYFSLYHQLLHFSIAQFFYPRTIEKITKDWFTTEEVSKKRKQIALILRMMRSEMMEQQLQENTPCGLRNLGNTCYMNSILQCVSNTQLLSNYFVSGEFEGDLTERQHVACELAKVFT